MESDMIMESSSKLLKMGIKLKCLIIGLVKETHGKSKDLMFNIRLNFMAKQEKLLMRKAKKKFYGKIMNPFWLELMIHLSQDMLHSILLV